MSGVNVKKTHRVKSEWLRLIGWNPKNNREQNVIKVTNYPN